MIVTLEGRGGRAERAEWALGVGEEPDRAVGVLVELWAHRDRGVGLAVELEEEKGRIGQRLPELGFQFVGIACCVFHACLLLDGSVFQ